MSSHTWWVCLPISPALSVNGGTGLSRSVPELAWCYQRCDGFIPGPLLFRNDDVGYFVAIGAVTNRLVNDSEPPVGSLGVVLRSVV